MHEIEHFYRWHTVYDVAQDERSPFYGKEYNYDLYSETIYGYYLAPGWDFIGSETLYIKVLFADYDRGFVVMEMIGEWNDAINNDIMHLKRNIIEHMMGNGIHQFILIGENVFNFHGSDDSYYEEWYEELEEEHENEVPGWIAFVNFADFVLEEMEQYNLGSYINFGGSLQIDNWRTKNPLSFYKQVQGIITRRLDLP